MGTRNRNSNDQRDDFLLETNFDDDGALTRAYNNNSNNNNRLANSGGNSENTRPRAYRSNVSIDRYSDAARSTRKGLNIPKKDFSVYVFEALFIHCKTKNVVVLILSHFSIKCSFYSFTH